MKQYEVKVTSVHYLYIEADSEDAAKTEACSKAWEYDADEINAEIVEGWDIDDD